MLKFNFKKKNFLINTQVIFGQLMPFVYFFDYFVKHKSVDNRYALLKPSLCHLLHRSSFTMDPILLPKWQNICS